MTDLNTMLVMLKRANIQYTHYTVKDVKPGGGGRDWTPREAGDIVMSIERGYPGFSSELVFDAAGALKSIEAYE